MADYKCPRCNEPVTRAQSGVVARQFGVVGMLVSMATAGFECAACGPIPKTEFSSDARSQMGRSSMYMVVGAVVVFGAVMALLVAINA